jgi:putative transposase
MPRRVSPDSPSYFHVLNRSARRLPLFEKPADYSAFIHAMADAHVKRPVPLLAYCVMPNHFHLIVGPTQVIDLSRFMHRLTMMHSKRWHAHRQSTGTGAVYQGRFRSFLIEDELRLFVACRYVERNPLRARLVERAEEWPWSSLGQDCRNCNPISMAGWPIPKPAGWIGIVNSELTLK